MSRLDRIFYKSMYWIGIVVTAFILAVPVFAGINRVVYWISNPAVEKGVATRHSYDDGHVWYFDVTFGRYTFRTANGGREQYLIEVTDKNGHTEWWEVSREDFYAVEDGQPVTKSQFQ